MVLGIQQCVAVSRLTPSRRFMALGRVRERAADRTDCADLLGRIDQSITVQRRSMDLTEQWRNTADDRSLHGPGAREADAAVDRALTGLCATLQNIARVFGPAEAKAAKFLLAEVFPDGAGPIVNLTYAEQHGAVQTILTQLEGELADGVARLALQGWVQRLRELDDAVGVLLTRPRQLTRAEVDAADDEGQAALAGIVARILGRFPDNEPEDVAARAHLLEPIFDQQRELSLHRASRRRAGARKVPEESAPPKGGGAPREPEPTGESPKVS